MKQPEDEPLAPAVHGVGYEIYPFFIHFPIDLR